ncbi:hypothetical protein ABZX62_32990 [Streptomyces flavidovirens]|uniref:hypothetical protein n=1 Tax=Streptomyces flavidovirens TaxID=67298 RepID=UPI0033A57311
MIKNLLRAATAAALAIVPVTMSPPAHAAETLPLRAAVHQLDLADESRQGYTRDKFRHWNAGQNPSDGCNTRNEVLISEAIEPPTIGPGCKLTGGTWWSSYDATTVSGPSGLDIAASACTARTTPHPADRRSALR